MTNTVLDKPLDCTPPSERFDALNNPYQRVIAKMGKQHRLLSVHWELTYRCNEECTHCYLDVFKPNARVAGEVNTEQVMRTLDDLAAMGALNLTFSGGEILVRRDLFELGAYARRKRFALRLMTNGLLITPEVADRIAELRPTGLEISLYAADAETHDRITRRRRSWELTTRAIRLLGERGMHVLVKTPLMRENYRQLDALRALADEMGAAFRYEPTISAKDNGGLDPLQHRMTYDDLVWYYRHETKDDDVAPHAREDGDRSCSIGLYSIVLDPYGNVFPCLQTRISAGNVLAQPVREIWQSAVFKETSKLTFGELPVCRTCELNSICHRCHANALVESGSLYLPAASNCREALARRQVLIERGILPPTFPVPAHLQNGVPDGADVVQVAPASAAAPLAWIPLETIARVPAL